MKQIERLISKIKPYLPLGWKANECFLMSMQSGKNSPEMIMLSRGGYQEGVIATPKENRSAWKKQWRIETMVTAKDLTEKFKALGFKSRQDSGWVYIQI